MSLFAHIERDHLAGAQPLAARMRPGTLDQFVGQSHFLGEGRLLRKLLATRTFTSLIFYGPPGTGKTTLARIVAGESDMHFESLSAVASNVKELRAVLAAARDRLAADGQRTLLFVDEIHRFNRSQQDVLLHDVEEGIVVFVGATTSNPFFAVNSALVSRSHVFQFQPLTCDEIARVVERAVGDSEHGLGGERITVQPDAMEVLATACDGDARRALSIVELAACSTADRPLVLTAELIRDSVHKKALAYDGAGDDHYDTASALIKSIRGSDPDAALYWLARMLESGEDVRFITRRLVILASEDVGNADPQALVLASAAQQACEFVGLPECQWALAQLVIYLACAPKSNAAALAVGAARSDIRENGLIPVPRHLRDSHYASAAQLGHGQDYQYPHDDPDGVVSQEYLSVDRDYYQPTDRGFERELAERLRVLRARVRAETSARP